VFLEVTDNGKTDKHKGEAKIKSEAEIGPWQPTKRFCQSLQREEMGPSLEPPKEVQP
jgi:hypothetical protein